MSKKPFIVALSCLIAGCAGMSSEQCATADWRALGYQDGAQGKTLQLAASRGQACAKHGFEMNHAQYNRGREQGLTSYCTASKGYSLGEAGKTYNGVCVDHSEQEFLSAYDQGYELYRFTSAVAVAGSKLQEAERRHARLDKEIREYAKGHRDEDLTAAEHNDQVLEIWSERKWIEKEAIPHWTVEKRYAQRELEEYQRKVADNDPALGSLRPSPMKALEPYPGPSKADAYEMFAEVLGQR